MPLSHRTVELCVALPQLILKRRVRVGIESNRSGLNHDRLAAIRPRRLHLEPRAHVVSIRVVFELTPCACDLDVGWRAALVHLARPDDSWSADKLACRRGAGEVRRARVAGESNV